MGTRYFQLRADGKRDPELYTSLGRAAEVLVRDTRATAHVVELDTPGGAVVREFKRQDCEEIVRSASADRG
jgi:membrane-bound ClpP family serine protease